MFGKEDEKQSTAQPEPNLTSDIEHVLRSDVWDWLVSKR
jgi:hypothetical protein